MFCDFVVWNKKELFVQRILPYDNFIQSLLTKQQNFLKVGILPEFLGNWYSKAPTYTLVACDHQDDLSHLPADSEQL